METPSDPAIPAAAMYDTGQAAPRAAVNDRQTQDATFQAPSSRSTGRQTPSIRLKSRFSQASPGNDSGTAASGGSQGAPGAVIPTTSSPTSKVDASLPTGNQQALPKRHSSKTADDATEVVSSSAHPSSSRRPSSTPPTMSKRRARLFRDDSPCKDATALRSEKDRESEGSEGEGDNDEDRPSSSVKKTYGRRKRASRAGGQAGSRKSHRASTGLDPLRIDATFDDFSAFADAAMARLTDGGHRFRILHDKGCWVKFYCANGKATAVPNKLGYIVPKDYVYLKGSAEPEKPGQDKGCVAGIAAKQNKDDSWTVIQYKGDHALECLIADSKHTYPAVEVELPEIGERQPDSDDEVKEILTAKTTDVDAPLPSDGISATDDWFDQAIDGIETSKRGRGNSASDTSSTTSVVGNGIISDDTENEDQQRRRQTSSTLKSSLPGRRAISESKRGPKPTEKVSSTQNKTAKRQRTSLPQGRSQTATVVAEVVRRKAKDSHHVNGTAAAKYKLRHSTPLKALGISPAGLAFFEFAELRTIGDLVDGKLLPDEVLHFMGKVYPFFETKQKSEGKAMISYSYVARYHDSEEIAKALAEL